MIRFAFVAAVAAFFECFFMVRCVGVVVCNFLVGEFDVF